MLASVLLRVLFGQYLLHDHWVGDAAWYKGAADALLREGWADPYWPPGLPHLLAGAMWLGINHAWLGMGVGLGLWVLYFWSLKSVVFLEDKDHEQGWWLKLIFALYPAFVLQSVVPLTYLPVAILLLMGWQWACGAWGGSSIRDGVGLGVTLGLMVLFRGASLALWPALLWGYAYHRERWQVILLPLVLATLMVGAWEMRLYQQEDRWIFVNSANSYNLFLGNNEWTPDLRTWWLGSQDLTDHSDYDGFYETIEQVRSLPEAAQDEAFRALAWEHIRSHPQQFMLRVASRFVTLFSFDTLASATIYKTSPAWGISMLALDALCYLLLIVLAWWGWGSQSWHLGERMLWLAVVGSYSLPYLLAFSHPTYHLPVLPLLAWAAMKGGPFRRSMLMRRSTLSWAVLSFFLLIQLLWIWNMSDRVPSLS